MMSRGVRAVLTSAEGLRDAPGPEWVASLAGRRRR